MNSKFIYHRNMLKLQDKASFKSAFVGQNIDERNGTRHIENPRQLV